MKSSSAHSMLYNNAVVDDKKGLYIYGVDEFLADAIIHPDIKRERDILERHLGIIKMLYTNHNL